MFILSLLAGSYQAEDYGDLQQKLLRNNGTILIMFYTPWCEHYHSFKQKWEGLRVDGVVFGEVNCVTHRNTCQEENIREYPTLRLYQGGQFVERYKQARETELLVKWLGDRVNK